MANIYPIRVFLYISLSIFSCILFGLCAARFYYTTHLPPNDPLNNGIDFYDPIVAELMITTFLTLLWCMLMTCIISRRSERIIISRFRGEFVGLFILWVLWIVGAAYSSNLWGKLKFCWDYPACRILTAIVAFSWIGWIALTAIALISIIFVSVNRTFNQPLHGRYHYDNEGNLQPESY